MRISMMNSPFLAAMVSSLQLLPLQGVAQDLVSVKGRVVDSKGEAIEYVQLGMPSHNIGTISSVDGLFSIEVPPADTLHFHHVSYRVGKHPVTGPEDDLTIVLEDNELPPAVSFGGDTKEKFLLKPGGKILGDKALIGCSIASGTFIGSELGSSATARKPFLVQDIIFEVHSNSIPGCVASINIYRIEGKNEAFVNVLHKPIYFDVPPSDNPQHFDLQPEEPILLEKGKYFVAFQIVSCDKKALEEFLSRDESRRGPTEMYLYAPLHLKSSYLRKIALGEIKPFPVNIGIAVKGLEFQ